MKSTEQITSGSIPRAVVSLAWPVVAGMLMEFALTTTDFFWVGKLGPTAQDAVTTSMVVIWTVFSLISIISVGITALVSRHVGARDTARAAFYVNQGFGMAIGVGLLFTLAGYLLAPAILAFMDAAEPTRKLALPYLRIFFASSVLYFMVETAYAAFRASGDTRTPVKVGMVFIGLNMVLDPLLIFGIGPFPQLGVPGAGLATAVSALIAAALIIGRLFGGGLGYQVRSPFSAKLHFREMLKIARIGLPISSQQFVFIVVYWFLIKFVHQFGETAAAAMGIGNRMESFSYLTCFGFSIAASTLVGQNLGARQPGRAARCAWGSVGIAIGITFIITLLFLILPGRIASVFTDNAIVHGIAVDYLIILGLSQMTMAIEIVLEGAFGGAGDTLPPMLVMVPGSLARVPLAYLLAFTLDWGINGVWWTLTITTTIKALALAFWFKRGRWKLKEV